MVKKWLTGYTNGIMNAQDEKIIILMKRGAVNWPIWNLLLLNASGIKS
jgi:hypothetical protein